MELETSTIQPSVENVLDVPATARWIAGIAGNVLADSNFFDGSNCINIKNGRFDGDPIPVKDSKQMDSKLAQALLDIDEGRSVILKALDDIVRTYSLEISGAAPKLTISFDIDIAPRLIEFLQFITTRKHSLGQKQTDTLQSSYETFRKDCNVADEPNHGWTFGGTGALTLSGAMVMVNNVTIYSKSLQEYINLKKSKDYSTDLFDPPSKLYAMQYFERALKGAIESKALEIFQAIPLIKNHLDQQNILNFVDQRIITILNRTDESFRYIKKILKVILSSV